MTVCWASRELDSMPMVIRTACKIEKMMEFMVESRLASVQQNSSS